MCFPLFEYASAVAFNAQLSDSLPPPVKYISSFLPPIRFATSPLALSTALSASSAKLYIADGFP